LRVVSPSSLPEEIEEVSWVHAHMNTTLLLVFLTGCVVIGFIIKIILMLLLRWRKRREAQSFERKYSTTA
jgi:predicted permease